MMTLENKKQTSQRYNVQNRKTSAISLIVGSAILNISYACIFIIHKVGAFDEYIMYVFFIFIFPVVSVLQGIF